jgi:hypothetical protein
MDDMSIWMDILNPPMWKVIVISICIIIVLIMQEY